MDWSLLLNEIMEILMDPSVVFGGVYLFLIIRMFKGFTWLPLSVTFLGLSYEVMFIYSGEQLRRYTTLQELYELSPLLLIYSSGIAVWYFTLVALAEMWRRISTNEVGQDTSEMR